MEMMIPMIFLFIMIIAMDYFYRKYKIQQKKAGDGALDKLHGCKEKLKNNGIPEQLMEKYELLIDKLKEIIPDINEQYPKEDLTQVINHIASDYLPEKSVKPYLSLVEKERNSEQAVQQVAEGIDAMMKEVDEVVALLADKKTDDFSSKAEFLKQRFNV